jgi:hypothetical protein
MLKEFGITTSLPRGSPERGNRVLDLTRCERDGPRLSRMTARRLEWRLIKPTDIRRRIRIKQIGNRVTPGTTSLIISTHLPATNQEGYDKEFIPLMMKTIWTRAANSWCCQMTPSGRGWEAPPRVALINSESPDKVKALYASPAFRQAMDGQQVFKQRVYAAEGVSP